MKAKHVILVLAATGLMSAQVHAGNDVGAYRVSDAGAVQEVLNRAQASKATDGAHEVLASQVFNKAGGLQLAVLSPEEMKETRGAVVHYRHSMLMNAGGWRYWNPQAASIADYYRTNCSGAHCFEMASFWAMRALGSETPMPAHLRESMQNRGSLLW